nr:hypothetical protein [uncultured Agathobaculum sp.]
MSSDPSRFADEIIPKPLTCEEATLFLDENKSALAFRYIPTKGNDKGKQFLIFFNASLLRLFQRDGLKEEWYELGKKQAAEMVLIVKLSKPVKLGSQTFSGFWIADRKF